MLKLSSKAPRQSGVQGRGRRTFWPREQCVESKGQKLELGIAGTMSSGGVGFQDRSSVSSERQVRPQRGSQGRFWMGEETAWRCMQSWRRQGRAAGKQLEDCTFGPMKLLLITHSHIPALLPAPDLWDQCPGALGGRNCGREEGRVTLQGLV